MGRPRKQNTYRIEGDIAYGYDGQGNQFIIDADDVDRCSERYFSLAVRGYFRDTREKIMIHRFIMECPDDMVVDHINRDPSDNRKQNLRIVTQKQNRMNTGAKGYCKTKLGYMAYIGLDNKIIYLGYHDTEEAARIARNAAEKKYFGEFGKIS